MTLLSWQPFLVARLPFLITQGVASFVRDSKKKTARLPPKLIKTSCAPSGPAPNPKMFAAFPARSSVGIVLGRIRPVLLDRFPTRSMNGGLANGHYIESTAPPFWEPRSIRLGGIRDPPFFFVLFLSFSLLVCLALNGSTDDYAILFSSFRL